MLAASAALCGCSHEPPAAGEGGGLPTSAPSNTAASVRVRALRERFRGALDAITDRDGKRLRTAAISLPATAAGAVRLTDDRSGLAIAFSLVGAADVPLASADDLALYPHAAPGGGDLLHRTHAHGTEDFVVFEARPARAELTWQVDVAAVAGLRLVANTLEFLDAGGAPRLRVAPPYLVGADGKRAEATLSVAGCAVDTSPRAPWGRPTTSPGAASCAVIVGWDAARVTYPALLDPAWETTGTMKAARTRHAIASLPNPLSPDGEPRLLLLTGGFDAAGNALKSAEIYEPSSRLFSSTGDMDVARAAHTATPIPSSTSGYVFIAGGASKGPIEVAPPAGAGVATLPTGPIKGTAVYNPSTGQFTAGPDMTDARSHHTATALPSGQILVVGGFKDAPNQPSSTADLVSFAAPNPAPADVSKATVPLLKARAGHAAALLQSGDVLITGGIGGTADAALATNKAELFKAGAFIDISPAPGSNAISQMSAARAFHTAVTLANGDVLIAGGLNSVAPPSVTYWSNAEIFSPAANGFLIDTLQMQKPRAFHTATLLNPPMLIEEADTSGKLPGGGGSGGAGGAGGGPQAPATVTADVLIVGGFDGTTDLASAELHVAETTKETLLLTTPNLTVARRHAAAALVNAGKADTAGKGVIVIGGTSGAQVMNTAELFLKENGDPCSVDAECRSGFCTGEGAFKVCCNERCDSECDECNALLKQVKTDSGTCGPVAQGKVLPPRCVGDKEEDAGTTVTYSEVYTVCSANGTAQVVKSVSCGNKLCNEDKTACSPFCESDKDCSNGWCRFETSTCEALLTGGTLCDEARQCASEHCVDGVCCDKACDLPCQACDVLAQEGTCRTLVAGEKPHLDKPVVSAKDNGGTAIFRTACIDEGDLCAGSCDGNSPLACAYPGEDKTAADDACACDDTQCTTTQLLCTGDGKSKPDPISCEGFACADATSCKTACATTADCHPEFFCGPDEKCVALPDAGKCDGDHIIRVPGKDDVDCAPFKCSLTTNACRAECDSVDDCVPEVGEDGGLVPLACGLDHTCVKEIPAPVIPFCALGAPSGADHQRAPYLFALGALAASALVRRSRRRSS